MAKNSKRRRNGKLKKNSSLQCVRLNHEVSVEKIEISKEVLKRDSVNLPLRNDYPQTQEGKRLFREARRNFWELHPPQKKEIKRTRKVIKVYLSDELEAIRTSEKRSNSLKDICNTAVVQKGNAKTGSGRCISFINDNGEIVRKRPVVLTSIELEKSARLVRFIDHNRMKKTNLQLRRLKAAA